MKIDEIKETFKDWIFEKNSEVHFIMTHSEVKEDIVNIIVQPDHVVYLSERSPLPPTILFRLCGILALPADGEETTPTTFPAAVIWDDGEDKFEYNIAEAYVAGIHMGLNGPNRRNCDFQIFSTIEKVKAWQKGRDIIKSSKTKSHANQTSQ